MTERPVAARFSRTCAAALIFSLAFASSALAATIQVQVLLDLDNNPATGCTVTTSVGTFSGAEQVLTTTVDTAANQVTAVSRQVCTAGVFGAAIPVNAPYPQPWPIGVGSGSGGSTLIESYVPLSAIPASGPSIRAGFVSIDQLGQQDAILNGIVIFPAGGGPSAGIPTLSEWGLILLATLLAGAAVFVLRRGGGGTLVIVLVVLLAAGAALAAITLTGNPADWAGISPLATKAPGANPTRAELYAVYAVGDGANLFFRFDTKLCPVVTVSPTTLPNGSTSSAYPTTTFTQTGGAPPITWSNSGALPNGLNFSAAGVLSGSPTQTGTFPITFTATDANLCAGSQAITLTINACPPITVTPNTLAPGTANTAYASVTFTATGGTGAITWSHSGALPTGMSFSAGGVLFGTPTQTGSFPVTFIATDSVGCTGSQPITLLINCQAITVTNPGVATGTANTPFSQTFTQAGAIGGATFTTASTLPTGLALSAGGVLSGTPTQAGTFPITVTVTDANGCTGTGPTYTLVICGITVSPSSLPTASSGVAYSPITFTQTGGVGAVTFSQIGALPTGMNFLVDTLSGTPTQTGSFPITVKATDSAGCTGSHDYVLVVSCAGTIITVNPTSLPGMTAGTFTTTTFTATGGVPTYTFSQSGALPTGLNFSVDTLSGTPTQTGTFPITILATDSNGCQGSRDYLVVISCVGVTITVSPGTLSAGVKGSPYAPLTFTATGGTSPYSFSEAGILPTGMTFSAGVLSGTPTQTGSFPITVAATDAAGCVGSQNYTLAVNEPPAITSANNTTFAPGKAGQTFDVTTTGVPTNTITRTGTLPSGVTFTDNANNTATIAGTPAAGTQGASPYAWVITAANGALPDATQNFTFNVVCPAITVSGTIPALTFNAAMATATFTQVGGNGTITWSQTGLPTGVGINSGNGQVTGSPSVTGTFNATVTATDAGGCIGTKNLTVTVAPVANTDSYANLVDNTQFVITGGTTASPATPFVAAAGKITANDLPSGGVTVTAGTFATTAGGSVTVAGDGTFIYTPKVNPTLAATASDSFTYTISSNTGGGAAVTASGTVNLALANRVWYVKNNGAAGNGQSQSPFQTLAAGIAASTASDTIFVYRGDGTATNLATASILKAGQRFIGEGTALIVNGNTLVPAGLFPLIGNSLILANNVTVNGIDMSTGASGAIAGTSVTGVTVTARSVTTTIGTAVNIAGVGNTGAYSFQSISSNGATNGISLANTTGSFTVTGNAGSCTSAATCTGGAIQNATVGISLTSASNVSVDRMFIQNTTDSGIKGTNSCTNFTFTNGKIDNSGTSLGAETSNIAFNTTAAGTENNLSGTVTITGNTLTNAYYHGIDIFNFNGTISNANISNNTITSSTSTATSKGTGIRLVAFGSAGTVANVTKATIANNIVSNFPSANGILASGGNGNAAGPAGTFGTAGSATNVIAITSNTVAGFSAANRLGAFAIGATVNGKGQGNFDISCNGNTGGSCSATGPVGNSIGTALVVSSFGFANVTATVNNNVIVANNSVGAQGIGAGTSQTFANTDTPSLIVTISNNIISQTDGNGILVTARDDTGTVRAKIQNNTVAAPLGGVRPGIRVDAGNGVSIDDSICLNISGNTSAGSGGSQGIGLRKQGTVTTTNDFSVNGMAATSSPGVETYINSLNPAGGGTLLISATSGFSSCSLP